MRNKDYAISAIRLLAMCMIISCHICQYFGNELAWWLNCGVQVFLLISGYLYGNRDHIKIPEFYKRNLPKILIDYYLYVLIISAVYVLIWHYRISATDVFRMLLGLGTEIPGLGHLWFVSTIVLCYLITPMTFRFIYPTVRKGPILLTFVAAEAAGAVVPGLTGAWINCYIIGMMIGSAFWKNGGTSKPFFRSKIPAIAACAVFLNGLEIAVKYLLRTELNGIAGRFANTFFHYGHIALAMLVFAGMMIALQRLNSGKKLRVLEFSDRISYDVYLVHLVFIMGPCSFFAEQFGQVHFAVKTVLMFICSVGCAMILRTLSSVTARILHLNR